MSDIFHDAYASVVAEKERLKTQLYALAAENERLRELIKVAGWPDGFVHIRDIKHQNAEEGRDAK